MGAHGENTDPGAEGKRFEPPQCRGAAASAAAAEGTDWAAERGAVPSGGRGGRSWPSHLSDKGFASRYGDSNFVNEKIRVHF